MRPIQFIAALALAPGLPAAAEQTVHNQSKQTVVLRAGKVASLDWAIQCRVDPLGRAFAAGEEHKAPPSKLPFDLVFPVEGQVHDITLPPGASATFSADAERSMGRARVEFEVHCLEGGEEKSPLTERQGIWIEYIAEAIPGCATDCLRTRQRTPSPGEGDASVKVKLAKQDRKEQYKAEVRLTDAFSVLGMGCPVQ